MAKHWSKLPPVKGFTRVPDQTYSLPITGMQTRRMLQCDICKKVIPSLGVGYHQRGGKGCLARAAKNRSLPRLKAVEPIEVTILGEVPTYEIFVEKPAAAIECSGYDACRFCPPTVEVHPLDLLPGDVLVECDGHPTPRYEVAAVDRWDENSARLTVANVQYPFLYIEHDSVLRVERAA